MNLATIFNPPADLQRDAFFTNSRPKLIEAYRAGRYQHKGEVPVGERLGEEAAEEAFDLTNNPSRDDERQEHWPNRRSVSVSDIVLIGADAWLCASVGWTLIV